MKILAVIPARHASTRFPGKPLAMIAGKPLLQHVVERCQKAQSLSDIIVATDDTRIWEVAQSFCRAEMTSPDHPSGTDRIAEVIQRTHCDGAVNIQGDEPLIDPRLIDKIVQKLRRDRKIDIVTAGHPFSNPADISSPHQVKVAIDHSGRALDFSRKPITTSGKVLRHQGIYGFRRAALLKFVKWKPTPRERAESLEQLRALENGVRVHVLVTKHGSSGVDTPEDAKALEQKLARAKGRSSR